ncbi:hypothetical protein [Salinicola endophyticus]|uniref:Tail assembly chaperone n=1 Tax=Salinicola endophyticus TaxID=1949083 RepID=A0AB74UA88_9GAMM
MARFVLGTPSVTKTIKIQKPGHDAQEFTAEIRLRSRDDQDALEKARNAKPKNFDQIAVVREDVLSVSGIDDANGKELESTPELIDAVFQDSYALNRLMRAWSEVQLGLPEAEAKN